MRAAVSLLSLLLPLSTLAADVAVFSPSAINMTVNEADAAAMLIAQAYARESGLEVLGPHETRAALTETGSMQNAAGVLRVAEYIELTAVGLSQPAPDGSPMPGSEPRIIMHAIRRAAGGQTIHRVDMTAASLADMNDVANRLARALFFKTTPDQVIDRHNVTDLETRPPKRAYAERTVGMRAGFAFPVATDARFNGLVSLAVDTRIDRDCYFLQYAFGTVLPAPSRSGGSSYGGIATELGASWYIVDAPTSPYIGGGITPRLIFSATSSPVNIGPYLHVGVMMGRETKSRVYMEMRVMQNITPIGESRAPDGAPDRYPTEVGFQLGVAF